MRGCFATPAPPTSSCTMFLSFLTWAWLLRANDVALHATTSTALRHAHMCSHTPMCTSDQLVNLQRLSLAQHNSLLLHTHLSASSCSAFAAVLQRSGVCAAAP